jgi:hypothetical protein
MKDELPENFETFEDLADFWDNHDLTDYEEHLTPLKMEVDHKLSHEYEAS